MRKAVTSTVNDSVMSALLRAETVILFLTAQGVSVKAVSLRNGQPVIRIARHAWCDRMARAGKARYDHTGHDHKGRFRQGIYTEDGCRVVWSESIH